HFSEGLALIGKDGVKMAYIDKSMRVVFNMKDGEYGGEFHEGRATIRLGVRGKFGYMDRTGRTVIPAVYDDARDFSEGLALVSRDGRYGFIDKTGKVVIPLQYFYGSSFSEGLAAVTTSSDWQVPGWGYIDREGRVRVPLKLDYAAPFSGGLGAIDRLTDRQNIPDAYIDPQGRLVWEKPRR
ncbi:MAG TPA: WG repeat-containing protein, partial [Pyrinomonadaceae bacterium]|nr:WG repeat-containing protein [Pyrinomonadaceae bacterium]